MIHHRDAFTLLQSITTSQTLSSLLSFLKTPGKIVYKVANMPYYNLIVFDSPAMA